MHKHAGPGSRLRDRDRRVFEGAQRRALEQARGQGQGRPGVVQPITKGPVDHGEGLVAATGVGAKEALGERGEVGHRGGLSRRGSVGGAQ